MRQSAALLWRQQGVNLLQRRGDGGGQAGSRLGALVADAGDLGRVELIRGEGVGQFRQAAPIINGGLSALRL